MGIFAMLFFFFFLFKQKTAYEMRISDWSSDVCSSDLLEPRVGERRRLVDAAADLVADALRDLEQMLFVAKLDRRDDQLALALDIGLIGAVDHDDRNIGVRQQLLQRAETEQYVAEHLYDRDSLAGVQCYE